jgi:hypothetical protein
VIFCDLFYGKLVNTERIAFMAGWIIGYELKRMWKESTWANVGRAPISTFALADLGSNEYAWSENCVSGNKNETGHLSNTSVSFIVTRIHS